MKRVYTLVAAHRR